MTQAKPLPSIQFRPQYLVPAAYLYCALAGLSTPILSDEAFSLSTSVLPLPALLDALRQDVHPPLYYLLLHLWFAVIPVSLAALRLISGLGLLATGYFFWRFLRAAGQGESAWAGTALLLSNPLLLMLAGYGRMYTWLAAVCVATLWAGWMSLRGSRRAALVLMALTTVGLLTHNWFVFFLMGLGGMALSVASWRAFRLAVPVFGGGFLYMALWGDAALSQLGGRGEQLAWLKRPEWTAGFEALSAHLWMAAAVAPVLLIWVALRGAGPRTVDRWAAALAGVACALLPPLLVSQWKPIYNARFTVVAAPFLAWALCAFVGRAAAAIPVLALAACVWTTLDARRVPPCNSRTAAEVLQAKTLPGDTVVFCRLSRRPVDWYWQAGADQGRSFPSEIDDHPGYEGNPRPQELQAEAQQLMAEAPGRIVVLADTASPASEILLMALRATYRQVEPPCLACGSAGKHYFNRLLIFEKRTGR